MSIKDLFGKTSRSLEETAQDVESVEFVDEKSKKQDRYLPPIDFSKPENFAFYGSAELYYDAAIRRIYEDFPYDGSKKEQIQFEESASDLERWLYSNKYPKTTGYISLGTTAAISAPGVGSNYSTTTTDEYIRVWGGLHTDTTANNLSEAFEKSATYDAAKNRNQNWNCDFSTGATIEFLMNKSSFDIITSPREVILDLWNGEAPATADYARLTLEIGGTAGTLAHLYLRMESGAAAAAMTQITNVPIDFGEWAHYAVSIVEDAGALSVRLYVNGDLHRKRTFAALSKAFVGKVDGFIGALQAIDSGGHGTKGDGKLLALMDEFRFWKTRRTSRQIKLNWFSQVGGGASTDDATSALGVYFKFNEGITNVLTTDSTVLDYSGRLANGTWEGYPGSAARNTGSGFTSLGYTETLTPIIYSTHASVASLATEMQVSGSDYDALRGQSFYNSMPDWLIQEDNGNFRKLSHILASYLDVLHVQIKQVTELKNKQYTPEEFKASTLAPDLLTERGFSISNMFTTDEVYEKLKDVDLNNLQYSTDLNEIKNIIYTNIYNNLEKIYKSKGTEGSIRNLVRCFGVDDELIKLNLYTDGGTQYLSDKTAVTSVKKKYINFNQTDYFSSTIYQIATPPSTSTFISGSTAGTTVSNNAFTLEADIVVPYKKGVTESGYFATPFTQSSIFGFHEADSSNPTDYTWASAYGIQVYLIKDSQTSRDAKFRVDVAGVTMESDYIYDIYDNTHWNIAVSIKPATYPYSGGVTNTTPEYSFEFYAVSHDLHSDADDYKEVQITSTLSNADGVRFANMAKRVYAGAHRTNFTSSVVQKCDVEIGSVRAWLDYLDGEEIRNHNKDISNYGSRRSIDGSNFYTVADTNVPTHALTILNWDFDTVATSDGAGQFIVDDTTSGATNTIYGWVDDIIRREHRAQGDFFPTNNTGFIENEFLYAQKKQLPSISYDADNIYIKGEQQINFSNDEDVSDNFFMLEKSPSTLVSEQMLKSFSTTLEFANLFGRPVDHYRIEYKDLAKARDLFFEKVESDMDFDKFFDYFKWIDSSISQMIQQLIPLSANFAGGIVDVIEPHILERDKYQRQIGLLSTVTSTETSIRGVQELKYNWKIGHAPVGGEDYRSCLWQKERKEREDIPARETIRQVLVRQTDQEFTNPINLSGSNGIYQGQTYATRRFSRPYSEGIDFANSIHGGINFDKNKQDIAFLKSAVTPHGRTGGSGAPKNIITIGVGTGNGLNPTGSCQDAAGPNELIKRDGTAMIGRFSSFSSGEPLTDDLHYVYQRKVSHIFPGNVVSSSVNTGYSSRINKSGASGGYAVGVNVVNLHSDTTDVTNEIPIQGPFTNQWVGGQQVRHVAISPGPQDRTTRPELWRFLVGTNPFSAPTDTDGAMGFTGPDYGGGYPVEAALLAPWYREGRTKRPVNIKNIQTVVGQANHGNFQHQYEVLSTFGDQGYFLRRAGNLLPNPLAQTLPETTNYATLIAQRAGTLGNLSLNQPGGEPSNRLSGRSSTLKITTVTEAVLSGDHNKTFTLTDALGVTTTFKINAGGSSVDNSLAYAPGGTTDFNLGGLVTDREVQESLVTKINAGTNIDYTATSIFADPIVLVTQNTAGLAGNTRVTFPAGAISLTFTGTNQFTGATDAANQKATQDRTTGSAHVIRTRFSAPGGPEVNSPAYLDVATQQFSVHNSMNFRNLSVLSNGSGEQDVIRVNSQSNRREGLRTLRSRYQGQFGIDSKYGVISSTNYISEASFHKQHRNTTKVAIGAASSPTGEGATVLITTVAEPAMAPSDNKRFTLTDSDGVTTTFRITGGGTSADNPNPYAAGTTKDFSYNLLSTQATVRDSLIATINAMTAPKSFTATPDGLNVLVTQNTNGTDGNTEVTFPNGAGTIVFGFSGPDAFTGGINAPTKRHDNAHFNTPLPASDFQYSWINSAISGSNWENNQKVLTYAPSDGLISSSSGITSALTFPTISSLYGEN